MDIYSFINSKDVADYLRKIDYKFTTLEAAYLVWQNKSVTLREKHRAWEEIIQTMPNCAMPERRNMHARDDFHEFLRAYMKIQRELVQKVCEHENAVYFYSFYCTGDQSWCEDFQHAYPDMESCKKAIEQDYDLSIEAIRIKKQMLANPDEIYILEYDGKFEIMDVDAVGVKSEWNDILDWSFEGMWFAFPTPFKRGDIVVTDHFPLGNMCGEKCVFVLSSLFAWDKEQAEKNGYEKDCDHFDYLYKLFQKDGDITDMCAEGYFQGTDGSLYSEVVFPYLDLEYYRGPLDGTKRILTALSMYMQDELDIVTLMEIYHIVLQQENADASTRCLNLMDSYKDRIGLK